MKVTAKNVVEVLVSALPELRQEIEEDDELFHLQIASVGAFAIDCLKRGDEKAARRCVELVDAIFGDCDEYVQNAIYVSFLENIDRDIDEGKILYGMFTPRLKEAWTEMNQYNRTLELESQKRGLEKLDQ
jgi:hypothetical protein